MSCAVFGISKAHRDRGAAAASSGTALPFHCPTFSSWTTRFVSRSPALGLPCLSPGQPGAFSFLLGKLVVRGVNFRSLETTFGREILEGRAAVIDISVTIGSPELSSLRSTFFPSLSDGPGVGEGGL